MPRAELTSPMLLKGVYVEVFLEGVGKIKFPVAFHSPGLAGGQNQPSPEG